MRALISVRLIGRVTNIPKLAPQAIDSAIRPAVMSVAVPASDTSAPAEVSIKSFNRPL